MRSPLLLLAVSAFAQPVVLVNGYQQTPCESVTAESTFGQLPQKLRDLGREVVFFNNCSIPAPAGVLRPSLEQMGTALGTRIAAINAPEVDVVVHSMGGLIVRSYLAGKQTAPNTFQPPATHKIRKIVFLATPHFGPGQAPLLLLFGGADPQVRQIVPGSRFLFDLATWNQGMDDLRGVDAISVVGNVANGTDGLIPIPSATLNFAADPARTRIVPYCHTDIGALALAAGCSGPPYIANVNNDDHLSWRMIRSFIGGTEEWRTLGSGLTADTRGGLLVVARDKDDNILTTATAVTAGSTQLTKLANIDFFYAEQIAPGPQNITISAPGGATTANQTITPGLYSVAVVKPGPRAAAVLPAASRVSTRTLAPGMFISLYGAELATGSAAAQALPLPTTLAGTQLLSGANPVGLQFAGPTQINAILPEDAVACSLST